MLKNKIIIEPKMIQKRQRLLTYDFITKHQNRRNHLKQTYIIITINADVTTIDIRFVKNYLKFRTVVSRNITITCV